MPEKKKHNLFCYGTLKRGLSNHHYLKDATYLDEGILYDHCIFNLGRFPGIMPRKGKIVVGELYEITEDMLPALDRLEGVDDKDPKKGLYRRELVEVSTVDAFTYIYNNIHGYSRDIIESGYWSPSK